MDDNPYRSPQTVHAPGKAQVADAKRTRTERELRAIAGAQRLIIFAILGYFVIVIVVAGFGQRDNPAVSGIVGLIGLGTMICGLVGIVRLAINLHGNWYYGIPYVLAMFLPLIGIFVLASLNGRATRVLKKHGIRVGLLGANSSDLNAIPD